MRNYNVRALASIAMSILFPASMMMAETNNALMRTGGSAMLNGAVVSRNAPVLKGDVIAATTNPVSLSSTGNTILIPDNSRVRYEGSSISLESGNAVVTTANGMTAKVDTITVAPQSKSARYQVLKSEGKVTIAALSGSLAISDATHSVVLTEGYMTTIDPQADASVPSPGAKKDKPVVPWGMSGRTAIILGVGAAATAAVIAYWLTSSPGMSGK